MPTLKLDIDKNSRAYFWFVYVISDKMVVFQAILYLLLCRNNFDLINSGIVILVLSFASSEAIKALVKAPRPENPYLPKQTDTSFPSSHTTVSFTMTFVYFYFGSNLAIFVTMLLASVLVALGRVLGGAHYTRDVIAGAVLAFLVSSLGYYLGLRVYVGF